MVATRPDVAMNPSAPANPVGPKRTRRALHEEWVEQTFWWLYAIALLLGIIAVLTHFWRSRRDAGENGADSVS